MICTCATYGVIMAPSLATALQAPTAVARNAVGYTYNHSFIIITRTGGGRHRTGIGCFAELGRGLYLAMGLDRLIKVD